MLLLVSQVVHLTPRHCVSLSLSGTGEQGVERAISSSSGDIEREVLAEAHTGLECIEVSKVFRQLFLVIHSNLFHYSVLSGPLYISCNSSLHTGKASSFREKGGCRGMIYAPIATKAEAILKANSHLINIHEPLI